MKTLLLTGFEPFLNFPINPTMEIVKEFDGKRIGDYQVEGKVLSVDFLKSGDQLIKLIEETWPDAVISLGLAGGRSKITPERIAINCNDGEKDNKGYKPNGEEIIEGGPAGIFSTLPIKEMITSLHGAGFPAEISNSAGTYLCNNVMYRSLYHFSQTNVHIPSGFIHIPASHELALQEPRIPSWSHQDLLRSIHLCVESMTFSA